jgi:RNA polymerase sigma-70 factor (ECF subfamily)
LPLDFVKTMTAIDLAALARQAQSGDTASRDLLLRELYGVVRRHIYFMIGGGPLAEDAVQETMVAMYRGLAACRGEANPRTWAITIATRTAQKLRRREARHVVVDDLDAHVFDVDQAAAAELVMLQRALAKISEKKRDAFILMSILDLTAQEAGKVLGTFANTAASRDRHARAELETLLVDESARVAGTNGERETP